MTFHAVLSERREAAVPEVVESDGVREVTSASAASVKAVLIEATHEAAP